MCTVVCAPWTDEYKCRVGQGLGLRLGLGLRGLGLGVRVRARAIHSLLSKISRSFT